MYGKSRVIINQPLLDRITEIKQYELNSGSYDEWKKELIEKIEITRLSKMAESLNEDELAALILIAVENNPKMVYQIMLGEYLVSKERNENKNERRKVI